MNDEVHQLFSCLKRLLDSCADQDIYNNAPFSAADPEGYHAALDGIRNCTGYIRASGITRDQLTSILSAVEPSDPVSTEQIIRPGVLIPLILAEFSCEQENLISSACREWGLALDPATPEDTAMMIRSVIVPLSLADLLSPTVTRMQRFPAILALEEGGKIPLPGTVPSFEADDRILIVLSDDPALFSGQLDPAIFRFLVRRGILPVPFFPDLLLQALGDIGVIRGGGPSVLDRVFPADIPPVANLFRAGQALSPDWGTVSDVRDLFRVALGEGVAGEDTGFSDLERLSGHVLAGLATAAQGRGDICQILDFIRSVGARPSGRTEPGTGDARNLEKVMQEHEQLIRVITGDYSWRAVPLHRDSCTFRPLVDLWPDRHLILYDPAELAYRSHDGSRALLMEAFYSRMFGIDTRGCDLPDSTWSPRLIRVLDIRRAFRKGSAVHPGAFRWFSRFCREEYSLVNRCADRSRISRLPLPDQFLEAVCYEARTGEPAVHIRDQAVRYALDVTSDARKEMVTATDEECTLIVTEKIWPVFEQVCLCAHGHGVTGTVLAAETGKGKELAFTPRGTVMREDASAQSPVQPSAPLTGRTITGTGDNLFEDGGVSIPQGSAGTRVQADDSRGNRSRVPGSGGGHAPSPGQGTPGPGALMSGISFTADSLMDACTRSRDLLDTLAPSPGRNQGGPPADTPPDDPGETASALSLLSRTIDDLAGTLEQQLHKLRDTSGPDQGPGVPDHQREELDGLLKVSEKVRNIARDYKEAVGDLGHQIRAPGPGQDTIRQVTGITRKVLRDLQAAGAEFMRLSGASSIFREDMKLPVLRLPDADNQPGSEKGTRPRGNLEPGFSGDTACTPEIWENFSYYDATFDESPVKEPEGYSPFGSPQGVTMPQRFDQGEQALSREAELYLSTLKQRTRSDWETMDEKAERIRRIALFESHAVGGDDYAIYQRFYQPVAGLILVARKNIQQALQKSRANRDLNELISGDDIDEENLAAVKTTMRIFRDRGREPDRTRWCLSLLVDASSSMHDETVAKKLQAAIQAAILFGEAVNHIKGIRFEIAAFSDTEYIPLKRYQDDWNVHQGCYLIREVVRANGGTNDVGAVSSALDRMNRLPMAAGANRMIFVISDGQSGVGGREQMRLILRTNRNTRIFGWGIGPDMEKIAETYLPYGTWVPDIAELPQSLGEVLRRELGRPAMAGWRESRSEDARKQPHGSPGEGVCTN